LNEKQFNYTIDVDDPKANYIIPYQTKEFAEYGLELPGYGAFQYKFTANKVEAKLRSPLDIE